MRHRYNSAYADEVSYRTYGTTVPTLSGEVNQLRHRVRHREQELSYKDREIDRLKHEIRQLKVANSRLYAKYEQVKADLKRCMAPRVRFG